LSGNRQSTHRGLALRSIGESLKQRLMTEFCTAFDTGFRQNRLSLPATALDSSPAKAHQLLARSNGKRRLKPRNLLSEFPSFKSTYSIIMLSLIIPVYRNEENLPDLLEALRELESECLPRRLELVFVVDGSPDRCYERLREILPSFAVPSCMLLLSRNFGSFAAIRAGLAAGAGPLFAVMAADLQEPPELVHEMYEILQTGQIDVVVGVRDARQDPLLSSLSARIFWGLYRRFVVPEVPPGGVDVFGCNRAFRDQLLQLEERHSSLIAQIFWLGCRRKFISYARRERRHGKSAWNLRKKINYMMDSVFSFTDLPITLLIRVGGGAALLSGLFGLFIAVARLLGLIQVPGYAAIMLAIVFLGALNMFGLGIVGSYAWRTYENTKARPLHVVLRSHEFNQAQKKDVVD
jgi:glycosyltransferase involved in cell wall biosynthesis